MMAKMFYTMEEAKATLAKSEEEVKQYAREGRLREFRDGPRLMFKADQVEQLKGELESGIDNVDLGVSDSGGMIGLVDTTGASGTSITLSDDNTGHSSGAGMRLSDDSLSSDLGLSGSLGGVPSPARAGGGTGIGMSGPASSGGSRAGGGINVFGAEDTASGERVDPSQQTVISPGFRQQMALEGVGSGSGLLDLTRESDDTSLGAVLDEITPSGRSGTGRSPAVPVGDSGLVSFEDEPVTTTRVSATPQYVERADASAPVFGGLALAGSVVMLFGAFVLITQLAGNYPPIMDWFAGLGNTFLYTAGMGVGLAIVFGIAGMVLGKTAAR
jgi:hypothetical protein